MPYRDAVENSRLFLAMINRRKFFYGGAGLLPVLEVTLV
jgi:hypothetical protein